MVRDFRFGVALRAAADASSVGEFARRAERIGYHVLHIRDHLGAPAPFPTLMAAAAATETLCVGTFVLNTGFYRPALLARDVATMRDLTGGRLQLGLGAGSIRQEFEAAELAFPSPGQRVEHLRHVTNFLREHVPDVPILIGGNGNRVLTLAAERAQIVGFTTGGPPADGEDPVAERIALVRNVAADRFDDLELNTAIAAMPVDGSGIPDVAISRPADADAAGEHLRRGVGVLSGGVTDMADQLRRCRDTYGISYFSVQQKHAEVFAKVIALLR